MFCCRKRIYSRILFERDINKISIVLCFNKIFEGLSNRFISLEPKRSQKRSDWEFSWFIDSCNNISIFFYTHLKPWSVLWHKFERVPEIFLSIEDSVWSNDLWVDYSLYSINNIRRRRSHKRENSHIGTLVEKHFFCRLFSRVLISSIYFYELYLCSNNPTISKFFFLTNLDRFHRFRYFQIWDRNIEFFPCDIPDFFFVCKKLVKIDIDKIIKTFLLQTKEIRDLSISSWLSQKDSSILLIIILEKLLSLRIELIFFFFNRRNRLTSLRSLFCCGLFFIYHQVCYREINGNKWTVSHPAKLLLLKRTRFSKTTSIVCSGFNNSLNKAKTDKKVWFLYFFIFYLWDSYDQALKNKIAYNKSKDRKLFLSLNGKLMSTFCSSSSEHSSTSPWLHSLSETMSSHSFCPLVFSNSS